MSRKYGSVKVTPPELRLMVEELPPMPEGEPIAWASVDVDDWFARMIVWGHTQEDADALALDVANALRAIRV